MIIQKTIQYKRSLDYMKKQRLQNIVIYKTKEGPSLEVKLEKETLWLTLNQIALLFDVQKAAISKHIKNIFKTGELGPDSTVSKMETVQMEGNRRIKRLLTYFIFGDCSRQPIQEA